jgi:hypothetical protein
MNPSEVNYDRFTRVARLNVFADPNTQASSFLQDAAKICEKTSDHKDVLVAEDHDEILIESDHFGDPILLDKDEAHVVCLFILDTYDEGFNDAFDAATEALEEAR